MGECGGNKCGCVGEVRGVWWPRGVRRQIVRICLLCLLLMVFFLLSMARRNGTSSRNEIDVLSQFFNINFFVFFSLLFFIYSLSSARSLRRWCAPIHIGRASILTSLFTYLGERYDEFGVIENMLSWGDQAKDAENAEVIGFFFLKQMER